MTSSLVGSEMCIRDRELGSGGPCLSRATHLSLTRHMLLVMWKLRVSVSYTHLTLPTICSV
eukprot:12719525-Prorocentrum_lima.AAC.1